MIGGGAALAALSGALLEGGHGSFPLQWVMLLSAIASLISIFLVLRRERAILGA
jgi:DHA1 family bicyclomycin/chloramphenicol resistance-like MFS transporter